MKKLLILFFLLLTVPVYAGTFKNISNRTVNQIEPGQSTESLILLDKQDPTVWQRESEEPTPVAVLSDDYVTSSTQSTEELFVDWRSSYLEIINVGDTSVEIYFNEMATGVNPIILEPANANNDADYLLMENNTATNNNPPEGKIERVIVHFTDATGGNVKVRALP